MACFWKNFWKAKLDRANLQWRFLSHFSHIVKEWNTLCQVGYYFLTFALLKYSLNFAHMLDMEKIKIVFTSEMCITDDWHFRQQGTGFILRFAVCSYWDWLSGKHFAKSLDIKFVGTATFMPGSSS